MQYILFPIYFISDIFYLQLILFPINFTSNSKFLISLSILQFILFAINFISNLFYNSIFKWQVEVEVEVEGVTAVTS